MGKSVAMGLLAISGVALLGFAGAGTGAAKKATVRLYLSTDCPVAMQYTPRINRLVEEFSKEGVQFEAYFPNDLETREGISAYAKERGYGFSTQLDLGGVRAKRDKASHVPTFVVVDAQGKVTYRGGFDDNKDGEKVKKTYLRDAIAATIAWKSPAVKEAPSFGCVLMAGEVPPEPAKVTYAEHIAPILNNHCVECHRPGQVAPFSLTDYPTAKKWAPMLAQSTEGKRMPPWKAVKGHGEFLDENRLSEVQIATLKNWNEAGAPSGDLKKAPKPPAFAGDWPLGEPSMTLQATKPFKLAAEGQDEYRNFVFDPKSKETLWVTAMDVRPGNRQVVHHVIAFIDTSGQAEKKEKATTDGQEGYVTFGGPGFTPYGSLGGWAPGLRARHLPEGTAFEVPPGAKIVMQVHYHRNGAAQTDQTKLGIYLAKQAPAKKMEIAWLANPLFRIPAGAKAHRVDLMYRLPYNATLYSSMPHMHLLGRSMKADVEFLDGETKPLVYVDDWDFNWQMNYALKEPMKLPKGARIRVTGTYDNTKDNPNNPNDPPKDVTWGEETTDEMFLLVAMYTRDN